MTLVRGKAKVVHAVVETDLDMELEVMREIVEILSPLERDAQRRVLAGVVYDFQRAAKAE